MCMALLQYHIYIVGMFGRVNVSRIAESNYVGKKGLISELMVDLAIRLIAMQ